MSSAAEVFPLFVATHHHSSYPAINPSLPSNSLEGKVVLITGGGRGIGRATALSFAKAKAKAVIILGRTESTLQNTTAEIKSVSVNHSEKTLAKYFVADATDHKRINEIFTSVKAEFGAIDIVVDNKGYLPDLATLATADIDEWYRAFDVNIKGGFIVIQAFINNASPGATFISTNTLAGLFYVPNITPYGSSKLALLKIVEDAQVDYPQFRFFSLHPGVVESEMNTKSQFGVQDEEDLPADFTVWLAQPAADFLKGRLVWCNWDVEQLKAKEQEILKNNLLSAGVRGYPPF